MEIIYTDMKVEYIDHMGDDLRVVNAARVSFNKKSGYLNGDDHPFTTDKERTHSLVSKYKEYLRSLNSEDFLAGYPLDEWTKEPISKLYYGGIGPRGLKVMSFRDFNLIHFLARKNHWSPFAHTALTLKVKCPIFVSRQLVKHSVGLCLNEVSRRFFDGPVELYKMNFKENSGDKRKEGENFIDRPEGLDDHERKGIELYNEMLKNNIATEDARSVLPLNMMTEFFWTGNFASFLRVVKLRSHKDTQRQTREVSDKIEKILKDKFPVSWMAYDI